MANNGSKMRDQDLNDSIGMTGKLVDDKLSSDLSAPPETNRAENWTGNEERLYNGAGAAKATARPMNNGKNSAVTAAEDLYKNVEHTISEKAGTVSERAREMGADFMDKAKSTATDISDKASQATDYVSTTIKNNPVQSLLVGFGLGCVAGALVTRALRR
jgi:ElaB/YqjD/DUF883 family membrane-anchored ribosome-binding protein